MAANITETSAHFYQAS